MLTGSSLNSHRIFCFGRFSTALTPFLFIERTVLLLTDPLQRPAAEINMTNQAPETQLLAPSSAAFSPETVPANIRKETPFHKS